MLSGPGGVGKGTIAAALVAEDPNLWLSRSWTTRVQRPGEPDTAYVFVDKAEFMAHAAAGGFVEWAEIAGNLYGTPMPDPPEGRDVLLEIDVQGAGQVRERHPEALCIFVEAPSSAEQESRLRGRGDPEHHIAERLALADAERVLAYELNAVHVVNDRLDETVAAITGIIEEARRSRPDNDGIGAPLC
ncbi:guanylate kinase [Candidatus Poriferisocius sp.]|uniref:guanylate kinase n=1 Tax=Candidatus Poriferisocius sp. TaxID=3101276 RepID=UPI003B5BDE77